MSAEKCIICKEDVSVEKDLPISQRKYYIVGAGQLCPDCYKKIYIAKEENSE